MEKSDEIINNTITSISQISNVTEIYENFLCHICKGWPMKPLLCQNCDKYFCLQCAKENNENKLSLICTNCPKDMKSIITSPPKTVINLLSKAKFDCIFCKKNFNYEEIVHHALYCEENPGRKVICNKCQNEVGKDRLETHDCVEELLAEIKRTKEKLEEYDKTTPFNFSEYNKLKYTLK